MARYWLSGPGTALPWDPFDQLRRGIDELFERMEPGWTRYAGAFPPVNLYETADAFVLTAELSGVRSEDIEISIEASRVTLRGERKIEHPEDASLHRVERQSGVFRRTIELPDEVDVEKAEAVHRHGILMLNIPKSPQSHPQRIAVRSS